MACAGKERAGMPQMLRLHGDCHAGNVLWLEGEAGTPGVGPWFVDFDDARMGPAIQDLWMLLSGDRTDQLRQLADVLAGYEDFHEFDSRELHLGRSLAHLASHPLCRLAGTEMGRPGFPGRFPLV